MGAAMLLSMRPSEALHLVDYPEARQREAFRGMILVDHLDLLTNVVNILRHPGADQRRGDERPFIELDQRVDVRQLILEAGMERHMVAVEGEDLAAPARLRPFHVGGERLVLVIDAIRLGPVGRPTGLATPDQELVLLQALVESLVVLVDIRERLLPRLIPHDDVRFAHWCLPSNVLVWIEHIPGETSSPPWPVVRTTSQSLIWRSPASPRNCRIDSAMPVRSPR